MNAESPLQNSIDVNKATVDKFHADLAANPLRKAPRKILANALTIASYSRPDFRLIVEELATTLDDVLRPEYWANVGDKLAATLKNHPFALIEVIWGDGSKYLRLIVLDAQQLWARVKVLEFIDLDKVDAHEPPAEVAVGYTIKRVSPTVGWAIFRDSDKLMIKSKMGSREEAQKELSDLLKALKA